MQKNNILTYTLLVLTAVFWGGSFVLTKEIFLSAPSITPSIIVTLRLVVASIVFVPFLLITKRWQKLQCPDIKYFFILAFLEPFTYFLCENNGIKLVPGGISSIIIATIPVFVPFGLYFAYHEKLHKINIIGVILSLVGIAVMISGDGMTTDISMKGILLLFGAVGIRKLTMNPVKQMEEYAGLYMVSTSGKLLAGDVEGALLEARSARNLMDMWIVAAGGTAERSVDEIYRETAVIRMCSI